MMNGTSAAKMFFFNLIRRTCKQKKGAHLTTTDWKRFYGKNFSTSQNKKTSNSLRSATHFPTCFISSLSPQFQFTFSENAKELCEHRAFTFVLYGLANTGPDGLFDKSWYWSLKKHLPFYSKIRQSLQEIRLNAKKVFFQLKLSKKTKPKGDHLSFETT